MEDTSFNKLTG